MLVGGAMLGAGMEMAQKNTSIARGDTGCGFGRRANTAELVRRHDEQELVIRLRHEKEILRLAVAPAGGNGDAMFVIDLMTKFSGVEDWSCGHRFHPKQGLFHINPLPSTLNHPALSRSTELMPVCVLFFGS